MDFQITRENLEILAQDADIDIDRFRTDYSGRGMYGDECLALTVDGTGYSEATMLALTATVALNMDVYQAHDVFGSPSADNMGTGSILYWRGITVIDD